MNILVCDPTPLGRDVWEWGLQQGRDINLVSAEIAPDAFFSLATDIFDAVILSTTFPRVQELCQLLASAPANFSGLSIILWGENSADMAFNLIEAGYNVIIVGSPTPHPAKEISPEMIKEWLNYKPEDAELPFDILIAKQFLDV